MFIPNSESYAKDNNSIWKEIILTYNIKKYQSDKKHTTTNYFKQFIRDLNKCNYQDEDTGSEESNIITINPFYAPTKYSNKSRSRKKQKQLLSLSNKSESITSIQRFIIKDENVEKNEIKEEKKPLFVVNKENDESLENEIRADNIREKIARHILNEYHFNKVKNITEGIIQKKFKKFPKNIPNKTSRKINKGFLEKTLKAFYEDKEELYKKNKIEKAYEHNLSIIKELGKDCYKDFREKSGFDDILEMTFSNLVVEYLKSDDYYKYINKLKGKEKQYYIFFAEHFIEHYNN